MKQITFAFITALLLLIMGYVSYTLNLNPLAIQVLALTIIGVAAVKLARHFVTPEGRQRIKETS